MSEQHHKLARQHFLISWQVSNDFIQTGFPIYYQQAVTLLQADLLFRKDLPESYQENILGYLETRLAAHPYVAGEEFTCGDVAVGAHLLFFKVFLPQVHSPSAGSVSGFTCSRLQKRLCFWQQLPISIV